MHGCEESISLHLPPLSVIYLRCRRKKPVRKPAEGEKKAAAPKKASKAAKQPAAESKTRKKAAGKTAAKTTTRTRKPKKEG